MDLYRFSHPSHIDEVSVVTPEDGSQRAYLHAANKVEPVKLDDIKEKLVLNGWQCIPASFEGKPTLEVRGFKNASELLDTLQQYECTSGKAQKQSPPPEPKKSLWQRFTDNTLQKSGYLYLVGDAAYMTYGYKGARKLDVLAGVFYLLGSTSLMLFGKNDKADLQIHDLSKEMLKHTLNANAPASCSLATITQDHNKGMLDQANEFMRRYPSEMMNSAFGLAGMCIAASAMRHNVLTEPHSGHSRFKHKMEGWLDVGLGSMTTISGAISTLVKEKKRDPDEPKHTGIQGIMEWIQEKPLRVAGYGYIASTLCHAGSTTIAMLEAKKNGDQQKLQSVPFRAAFVGASLIAEFLMSISSKGHGEGVTSDASVEDSMVNIAAELILKQPKELQEAQMHHMLNFLEHPSVLAEKRAVVEQKLREQMAALQNNPWLCMHNRSPQLSEGITIPALAQTQREAPLANWQQKVKLPENAMATASL